MKQVRSALLVLILLGAPVHADEPDGPKTAAEALAVLVAAKSYDEDAVGFAGTKSPTYLAYEVLIAKSPTDQWSEWTGHRSPVVRCYAVRALARAKTNKRFRAAVFKGLGDTARVNHFSGCCMGEVYVADIIAAMGLARFDPKDQRTLKDRLLAAEAPLSAREAMLWKGTFEDANVPRVLTLAREGNLNAVRGLAKRKHPEALAMIVGLLDSPSKPTTKADTQKVERRIHSAVMCVMSWPDTRFWPGLSKLRTRAAAELNHNWVRDYCHAVAGYENEAAARILTQLLDVNRGDEWQNRATAEQISAAIREHEVESFVVLRERLLNSQAR